MSSKWKHCNDVRLLARFDLISHFLSIKSNFCVCVVEQRQLTADYMSWYKKDHMMELHFQTNHWEFFWGHFLHSFDNSFLINNCTEVWTFNSQSYNCLTFVMSFPSQTNLSAVLFSSPPTPGDLEILYQVRLQRSSML